MDEGGGESGGLSRRLAAGSKVADRHATLGLEATFRNVTPPRDWRQSCQGSWGCHGTGGNVGDRHAAMGLEAK